jgi:hypothetical protein
VEEKKAKHHHCLGKGSTNTTYERPERVIQKGISEFFLKTYKNSRMKVD